MVRFCENCVSPLEKDAASCHTCGHGTTLDNSQSVETIATRPSKKRWVLFLVVPAIAIVLILLTAFVITRIGSRVPLDAQEFTYRMEESGFVVHDIRYTLEDPEFFRYALAVDTYFFFMEFGVLHTSADARRLFNAIRSDIEAAGRGAPTSSTSVDMPNFNRFTLTFEGHHHVVSRIESTIVFAVTSSEYRAQLTEVLRMLGY